MYVFSAAWHQAAGTAQAVPVMIQLEICMKRGRDLTRLKPMRS